MPLTDKGSKIMSNMKSEYGQEKGKSVFYASANKGTISGVEKGGSKKKDMAHKMGYRHKTHHQKGGGYETFLGKR